MVRNWCIFKMIHKILLNCKRLLLRLNAQKLSVLFKHMLKPLTVIPVTKLLITF